MATIDEHVALDDAHRRAVLGGERIGRPRDLPADVKPSVWIRRVLRDSKAGTA